MDETSLPNPQTAYARTNLMIEGNSIALNSEEYNVTAFRPATVYKLSANRTRFDIVVNRDVGHRHIFTKGFTNLTIGVNGGYHLFIQGMYAKLYSWGWNQR